MNIEAISTGDNPPEDINVIIEVPIGGKPIKYEVNKKAGARCSSIVSFTRRCAIPAITALYRTPCR